MHTLKHFITVIVSCIFLVQIPSSGASADNDIVLYSFCQKSDCKDGGTPQGSVVADALGNLYGTAEGSTKGINYYSRGEIYKLAPDGTETVLHSFCLDDCSDGSGPQGDLMIDKKGNLYGIATYGGLFGGGTAFALASDGTVHVLYAFCARGKPPHCKDGVYPRAGMLRDDSGNFYGITISGGTGGGVVFKLSKRGDESVLYNFCKGTDCATGSYPNSLAIDAAGNLYGTTISGGQKKKGVVFRLTTDGTYTVLHNFCSEPKCEDGEQPNSNLAIDRSGNLYGTTYSGGKRNSLCGKGCGVAFEIASDGTETVLYSFCSESNCSDGYSSRGGLILDKVGNLYGTTSSGGGTGCFGFGCGVVFRLTPRGKEMVLAVLMDSPDGAHPAANLFLKNGSLYGISLFGGTGNNCPGSIDACGTVFTVQN